MTSRQSRESTKPSVTRSAVVTGGAAGIGRAIAEHLLLEGYGVAIVDKDEVGLAATLEALGDRGKLEGLIADVSVPSTAARIADIAEGLGDLIVWVNNAGYNARGRIDEITEADFSLAVGVLFGGVFWGTAEAARRMLARGAGSIVNLASVQAYVGVPGSAAYAGCKGAVVALTRQVGAELAGTGVRCNGVAPGLIATELVTQLREDAIDTETIEKRFADLTPIGREGTPADIAQAVLFLADDVRSGFMTGQVLVVDGAVTTLCRGY